MLWFSDPEMLGDGGLRGNLEENGFCMVILGSFVLTFARVSEASGALTNPATISEKCGISAWMIFSVLSILTIFASSQGVAAS